MRPCGSSAGHLQGLGVFFGAFCLQIALQVTGPTVGMLKRESKAALSGKWPCQAQNPFGIPGMLEFKA